MPLADKLLGSVVSGKLRIPSSQAARPPPAPQQYRDSPLSQVRGPSLTYRSRTLGLKSTCSVEITLTLAEMTKPRQKRGYRR